MDTTDQEIEAVAVYSVAAWLREAKQHPDTYHDMCLAEVHVESNRIESKSFEVQGMTIAQAAKAGVLAAFAGKPPTKGGIPVDVYWPCGRKFCLRVEARIEMKVLGLRG